MSIVLSGHADFQDAASGANPAGPLSPMYHEHHLWQVKTLPCKA